MANYMLAQSRVSISIITSAAEAGDYARIGSTLGYNVRLTQRVERNNLQDVVDFETRGDRQAFDEIAALVYLAATAQRISPDDVMKSVRRKLEAIKIDPSEPVSLDD